MKVTCGPAQMAVLIFILIITIGPMICYGTCLGPLILIGQFIPLPPVEEAGCIEGIGFMAVCALMMLIAATIDGDL